MKKYNVDTPKFKRCPLCKSKRLESNRLGWTHCINCERDFCLFRFGSSGKKLRVFSWNEDDLEKLGLERPTWTPLDEFKKAMRKLDKVVFT